MRANWECMKKRDERKTSVCVHINRKLTNIATDAYVYCSRYMCLVHIKKNIFFSHPRKWMCVFCAFVPFLLLSFTLSRCLSEEKKKHTHKTPFTSHIDCMKTAFLCIKISDSHCECMAMSHKQEREREKWTGKNKTMFCFALWHSVGARRPS